MPSFGVTIAKLSPHDQAAERLLDMFQAQRQLAPFETTETSRSYDIEARNPKQARRQVADDLKVIGGNEWPDHLAIARADDPPAG